MTEPRKTTPKPGTSSSEFWIGLGIMIALTAALFTGKIDGATWTAGITATGSAYGISRGIAKK